MIGLAGWLPECMSVPMFKEGSGVVFKRRVRPPYCTAVQ